MSRRLFTPRPIAEVRRSGYRVVEAGVRKLVRALDEAGYVPVWSCEGHREYQAPPSWYSSPVLSRLTRAGIAWWRRPRVICEGPWAVDSRRLGVRGFDFVATSITIKPIAHGLMRALPGRKWLVESRPWSHFVQLGPRQMSMADRALDGRSDVYIRTT